MGATSSACASSWFKLVFVVHGSLLTLVQLASQVFHVWALCFDLDPVTAGCTLCVRADFGEFVDAVMLAAKPYAVLLNRVTVFQTCFCNLDTGCSLYWVS